MSRSRGIWLNMHDTLLDYDKTREKSPSQKNYKLARFHSPFLLAFKDIPTYPFLPFLFFLTLLFISHIFPFLINLRFLLFFLFGTMSLVMRRMRLQIILTFFLWLDSLRKANTMTLPWFFYCHRKPYIFCNGRFTFSHSFSLQTFIMTYICVIYFPLRSTGTAGMMQIS